MKSQEYNLLLRNPEIEIKYSGEYLAIIKDSIVAHGKDFKKVLKEAEKFGSEPFIYKVPVAERELIV